MFMMLRHLLSIMVLPFVAVVIVPAWLLNAITPDNVPWTGASLLVWLLRAIGLVLFLSGFGLFIWWYKAGVPRWIPRLKHWQDR